MNSVEARGVENDSRKIASLFTWIFWMGLVVLFAEVVYIPLKRVGFAVGTSNVGNRLIEFLDVITNALPAVALLAALWCARLMFRGFAEHGALTRSGGSKLRWVGNWLLTSGIATLVLTPSAGLSVSDGQHLPLSTTALVLACVGLAIRLLGRVLAAAGELKAENDQIV